MDPADVVAQLNRILASAEFSGSARLSRFLRLVVESAQTGKADSLKEYRIGVEVFDRGTDFDPRIDPIVRVQAARLRSKLLEYYAGKGAQDPIAISIPKGSYAPEIRAHTPAANAGAPPLALEKSRIAVLPFVNMSADPENEYFSDGLTEELINRLTRVPNLQVVARTSAFRFKGRNEDVREIGATLNAGSVLEGSVRRSGNELRVTAQLIDVASGCHLFSKTFQREFRSVFELQDELAQAVVDQIAPQAGPQAMKPRVLNPEAYSLYLRGMYQLSTRFGNWRPCADLFRESAGLDPTFAPAWAGLAHTYYLLTWFYQMPAATGMPLMRAAAQKALELDNDSAHAHTSLGIVESGFEWNWHAGEAHFRRAIELQPSLAIVYPFYANICLLPQVRSQEACAAIERALLLDPFNPLFRGMATYLYAYAGRYDEALRQFTLCEEIIPDFAPAVGAAAVAHEFQGDLPTALALYRKLCALTRDLPAPLAFVGHALALTGQTPEAREILNRLLNSSETHALDISRVYSGLRDADETLRWLEKAVDLRDVHMMGVPSDRRFAWLHAEPRYQNILRRMNLLK